VTGGFKNVATATASFAGSNTVTGGSTNTADSLAAPSGSNTVSGGFQRSASGDADWRAGTLFQDF
jgi:hypothetical protein